MNQQLRRTLSVPGTASPPPLVSVTSHGSKRERILAAGLKLFANEPYQAVTMDRVAEAANVAKGTLYLYFQSKEDLYLGILNDGLEAAARSYQSSIDSDADVRERLRRAIVVTIEFYEQRRDLLRLMITEEPRMAEARNRIRNEWRDRGLRFFTALIEEGIQGGVFRPSDPVLATHAIFGAMRSVMLFYGAQRPVTELSAELGDLLLRSLSLEAVHAHRKSARQI